MRNENRAVFDRASEQCDFAIKLPPVVDAPFPANEEAMAEPPARRSMVGRLIDLIGRKLRQRRNRLALLELSDDQLKDVGLSRSQAHSGEYSRYRRSASHALERNCR